jgi:RNA-directed DNA polymerase
VSRAGTVQLFAWLEGLLRLLRDASVLERLDQWIRHRLRSTIWKQWKRGKVRFRKLCDRGIGGHLAAQTAGSPCGPWRIANSPAINVAFPIAYFDTLGLPRLFTGS